MWPEAFIQRISKQFPKENDLFIESLKQKAETSIRINPAKFSHHICEEPIKYCVNGYFLNERPVFSLDPLWHAGGYYVQEASSMFLERLIMIVQKERTEPQLVLDLCASPGGKSTHLCSLLNEDDLLISNEVIRSRLAVLNENLVKWGCPNVSTCSNDPKHIGNAGAIFDLMLVDAPCSGEGLFRRDSDTAKEWSVENTNLCAARQRRILADSIPCLKEGAYLIYSTCTFNPRENEEIISWLTNEQGFSSIQIPTSPEWGVNEVIYKNTYSYRFLPHKVKSEGFFISLLQKTRQVPPIHFPKRFAAKLVKPKQVTTSYIQNYESYLFFLHHDTIRFTPAKWEKTILYLSEKLSFSRIGTGVGQSINNKIIPDHELAMSVYLNRNSFVLTEVTLIQAIKFLRKEQFDIDMMDDWQLIAYQNIPLGFVKKVRNRFNNYYPKNWRLRSNEPIPEKLWHY